MALDEQLRERLRVEAAKEDVVLDHGARARVRVSAMEHGLRRRPHPLWWAAALVALGLGAWLVHRVPDASVPTPSTSVPSTALAPARPRCAAGKSGDLSTFDAAGRLELREALLVKEGDARMLELAPCLTEAALTRGAIYVHARDLAGGRLVVRTALADVTVTGTAFAVYFDDRGLGVAVVEGSVQLSRGLRVVGRVGAGERLDWSPEGERRRAPLQAALRDHIEERLELRSPVSPTRTPAKPPSKRRVAPARPDAPPEEVEFGVERVWRRGAVEPSRSLDVGGPPLEPDGTPKRNWKLTDEEAVNDDRP